MGDRRVLRGSAKPSRWRPRSRAVPLALPVDEARYCTPPRPIPASAIRAGVRRETSP